MPDLDVAGKNQYGQGQTVHQADGIRQCQYIPPDEPVGQVADEDRYHKPGDHGR